MPYSNLLATCVLGAAFLLPTTASADHRTKRDHGLNIVVTPSGIVYGELRRSWRIDTRRIPKRAWRQHEPRRHTRNASRHPLAGLPTDRVWQDRQHATHRDFRPRGHVRYGGHRHGHGPWRHRTDRSGWWRW